MAWVQTARPPVDSAVAEVARAPAELPDISWSHPEVSIRAAGYGVAAVRDEMSLRAVLSGLEVPAGLPAHVPGPWLGAAAFSNGLGPDWAGFSPVHFRLPALLAWTAGDRHFLAAFGDGAQRRLDAARTRLDEVRPAPRPAAASVRRIANAGERARWTALVTRALAAIRAAVPFYGPNPPLEDVSQIKAAILAIYGELDSRIDAGIPAIREAMKKTGMPFEVVIYPGADHAFFNDTGQRYHAPSALDAWRRAVAWFDRYLKGS